MSVKKIHIFATRNA